MTDRGGAEVARVCPFVALDDDRDRRLSQPDHRHRCFAVSPPAPRAIAHQEAYCLSPSFPGCPVFQDWAQREAAAPTARGAVPVAAATDPSADRQPVEAHDEEPGQQPEGAPPRRTPTAEDAILAAGAGAAAGAAATAPAAPEAFDSVPPGPWDGWTSDPVDEPSTPSDIPRRRPGRRDWAAPPPWSNGDGGPGVEPPPFLADRTDEHPAEPVAAGRARARSSAPSSAGEPEDLWVDRDDAPPPAMPPIADDDDAPRPRGRSIAAGRLRDAERVETPPWERPRRSEAYPRLKTPMSLPRLGPVALGVIALIVAALILFFVVPTLLLGNGGAPGGGGGGATATPPAGASSAPSVAPSPAAPTPTVYVIRQGDTLSKIAKKFNISIDDLLAANPSIKNPNRITLGEQLIIPTPGASTEESIGPSASG